MSDVVRGDDVATCLVSFTAAVKDRDWAGIAIHGGHLITHLGDLISQLTAPRAGTADHPCTDGDECIAACNEYLAAPPAYGVGLAITPAQILAIIQAVQILLAALKK